MYQPEFPYKNDQLILSSNRVTLHSKTDSIFLFGKQAVSLSSTKTINLDAIDKVLIDAPKIELGNRAEALGEPVILGRTFSRQLILFLQRIEQASAELCNVSESNLAGSFVLIQGAGKTINEEASRLISLLKSPDSPVLSKTTFTR